MPAALVLGRAILGRSPRMPGLGGVVVTEHDVLPFLFLMPEDECVGGSERSEFSFWRGIRARGVNDVYTGRGRRIASRVTRCAIGLTVKPLLDRVKLPSRGACPNIL